MNAPVPILALLTLGAGCASTGAQPAEPLSFHVVLLPVKVESPPLSAPIEEGRETELALSFAEAEPAEELLLALDGGFTKVSLLAPEDGAPAGDATREAWIRQALEMGADLALETTLVFQETVHTSLNDRFWLNLPLHAIGGPFGWYVDDRSYHFDVRLRAEFVDVAAALDGSYAEPDAVVLAFDRQLAEASLDFVDRADGVGAYLLGLILPAGWVAQESAKVSAQLERSILRELSETLARSLRTRENEVLRGKLVDFYPRDVRTTADAEGRHLEGEFVLELGRVSGLDDLLYRAGDDREYRRLDWSDVALHPPEDRRRGFKRYVFRIPLGHGSDPSEAVQLRVTQLDRFSSSRTFTFPTTPTPEHEGEHDARVADLD